MVLERKMVLTYASRAVRRVSYMVNKLHMTTSVSSEGDKATIVSATKYFNTHNDYLWAHTHLLTKYRLLKHVPFRCPHQKPHCGALRHITSHLQTTTACHYCTIVLYCTANNTLDRETKLLNF